MEEVLDSARGICHGTKHSKLVPAIFVLRHTVLSLMEPNSNPE
jgi:hypothetical protein